jgi:hypothetical protein
LFLLFKHIYCKLYYNGLELPKDFTKQTRCIEVVTEQEQPWSALTFMCVFLCAPVIASLHTPASLDYLPDNAHCCYIVYDEDLPVDFQCDIEASVVRWVVLRAFPIGNHSHCQSGKVEQ